MQLLGMPEHEGGSGVGGEGGGGEGEGGDGVGGGDGGVNSPAA